MRQSLEIGIPLFLGKGEAGLRITSLRRLVADQKGDRRSAKGRGFSCRKRMIDQCLHQSASSMQGQRSDVFDKPVVLAPLYPAAGRIGAAPKYSRQLGRIQPRVFGRFLDRHRAALPVPAAGIAQSAAPGSPSTSPIMNCETCHHDCLCAVAIRSTKARHCGSGQSRAMSNQPRATCPRCAVTIVRAIKPASSIRARRIVNATIEPLVSIPCLYVARLRWQAMAQ